MTANPSLRVRRPKTQRGKRHLERRAPKLVENPKSSLVIRGGHTNETISQVLKDLNQLKLPFSVLMKRRNPFNLFENDTEIEKFAMKYDSSLFAFGSHSKKRPNNLILGRMYDFHVLDMVEFEVSNFKPIASFKGAKCTAGIKPCLIFAGEPFQTDPTMTRVKNLLTDYFRGETVENLRLQGIELALSFTLIGGVIQLRAYRILLKKSGTRVPRIEIEEMGPSMDLKLRKSRLASENLFATATKKPKELKKKSVKNVSHDAFGTKLGRIHVGKQDVGRLQTRKLKGLKRSGANSIQVGERRNVKRRREKE